MERNPTRASSVDFQGLAPGTHQPATCPENHMAKTAPVDS